MNHILTDDEIKQLDTVSLHWKDFDEVEIYAPSVIEFAKAIEQAILNKLSEQKPVAWLQTSVEDGVDTVIARTHKPDKFNAEWWRFDPLYLHPAPSVPEGYQLVPIEPTESMIAAMQSSGWMLGNYKAMLAAARSK